MDLDTWTWTGTVPLLQFIFSVLVTESAMLANGSSGNIYIVSTQSRLNLHSQQLSRAIQALAITHCCQSGTINAIPFPWDPKKGSLSSSVTMTTLERFQKGSGFIDVALRVKTEEGLQKSFHFQEL